MQGSTQPAWLYWGDILEKNKYLGGPDVFKVLWQLHPEGVIKLSCKQKQSIWNIITQLPVHKLQIITTKLCFQGLPVWLHITEHQNTKTKGHNSNGPGTHMD